MRISFCGINLGFHKVARSQFSSREIQLFAGKYAVTLHWSVTRPQASAVSKEAI